MSSVASAGHPGIRAAAQLLQPLGELLLLLLQLLGGRHLHGSLENQTEGKKMHLTKNHNYGWAGLVREIAMRTARETSRQTPTLQTSKNGRYKPIIFV